MHLLLTNYLIKRKSLEVFYVTISKTHPMNGTRLIPILLCLVYMVQGQQLSLFTQYRENASILNPAAPEGDFFAFGQNATFGASFRTQWVNIANSPRTAVLRGSFINDNSGFSLLAGGHIINDQTGPTGFTGIYGRIGGIISADPEVSGLSVGLSAGIVQYRIQGSSINFRQAGDGIGEQDYGQFFPDVGVGALFYTSVGRFNDNYFYAGVSVPQALGLDLTFTTDSGDFNTQRVQHFYAMTGFYIFFDNGGFLEPSSWIKYANNVPVNVDFNLRYQTSSSIWVGAGGSTSQTVHLETGVLLGDIHSFENLLKIGYGFDWAFNSFGPFGGTTHEINITYSIDR